MNAILTLARKDLKLLFRDKFALFWIFAFPLMYALFFGALFGDGGDGTRGRIPIAIVDEDGSADSKAFIERLAEHDSVGLARDAETGAVVLVDAETARGLVRKGQRAAYVRIPAGYGDEPFALFAGGGQGSLEVGIDPARSAERGFLQGILMRTVFRGVSEVFRDKDRMRREIDRGTREIADADGLGAGQKLVLGTFMSALKSFLDGVDLDVLESGTGGGVDGERIAFVDVSRDEQTGPTSAFQITFPSAMIWGLMGVAVGFAITLVRERAQGTLLRLRVAPIGRVELLAGKALGCIAMCMIVMTFLLVFANLALGVAVGSLPLAIAGMLSVSICFTGIMMTVSVMGKSEEAVGGASWGVMLPFAMIGGGMIPLIAMPSWLLTVSNVSPFKWGILVMEGAIWRGFTAGDMLLPCGVLVGIGVTFFAIGVAIFRRIDG